MDGIKKNLRGQTILITGGTGFMGKVLVEKLLRSIDLKHLYLMIRSKKGTSPEDRIDSLLSSQLFTHVKSTSPDIKSKLSIINSDFSSDDGLNLNDEDINVLTSQVNIIFHVAATVRFDEPLRTAYNINVRTTKQLLMLAKNMKNLKGFVYVSTAYSNCILSHIEEKVYDCSLKYDELERILNTNDDSAIEMMLPRFLNKYPNTYCFTKALAENVVADFSQDVPVAIFRPGIVTSSCREPFAGWMDNLNGMNGIIVGGFTCILRVVLADGNAHLNSVPVDMADNAMIAVASKLVQSERKEVAVYNYVSQDNPITANDLRYYLEKHGFDLVSIHAIWVYTCVMTKRKWLFNILQVLLHYIPGLIMDVVVGIAGIKTPVKSFWKLYRTIDKSSKALRYFTTRSWNWETTNIHGLWHEVSDEDKKHFRFDMLSLDWSDYFRNTLIGIRIYMMKDDMSTLQSAKQRYQRLTRINTAIQIVITVIVMSLILKFVF